ncbi:MFS transporter [Piscirickettsia salmonis]|uniref:MFS transporter n=1 Tax=Piscirickettsia salmonis TaxID=1238 RepID=UPI0007C958E3|nr:Proline/betaine transporter [Piscirickettsiaceae bacterium NZ-RLO1]
MNNNPLRSALGSVLEWYDFALYGFLLSSFSNYFFGENTKHSIILSLLIFFLGFLARPIGGLFFGYFGDKYGRSSVLKITPVLITLASICIPFIPSYEQIGLWSAIILVLTRITQGLFIGGEYSGNMVYLCESESNTKSRYFMGGIASITGSSGILLASLASSFLFSLFDKTQISSFAWKYPYYITPIIGLAAYALRRNMEESKEFLIIQESQKTLSIFKEIFKNHKLLFIFSIFSLCLHSTSFYFSMTFLPNFSVNKLNLHASSIHYIISIVLIVRILLIPLFSYIAGNIGGNKSMIFCIITFMIIPIFCMYFINLKGSASYISFSIMIFITAFNAAVVPGFLIENIPTKIRYTLFSCVFNIGFGIIGGASPLLAMSIYDATNSTELTTLVILTASIISTVGIYGIKYGISSTPLQRNGRSRVKKITL